MVYVLFDDLEAPSGSVATQGVELRLNGLIVVAEARCNTRVVEADASSMGT